MQEADKHPTMADLVNNLFRIYRHPDGHEYSHKDVEEGITKAAGRKLIDASYISKLRTGAIRKPSIAAVEALCHFFPVEPEYFFPSIVALRQRQASRRGTDQLQVALRSAGTDPDLFRDQLAAILRALTPPDEEPRKSK